MIYDSGVLPVDSGRHIEWGKRSLEVLFYSLVFLTWSDERRQVGMRDSKIDDDTFLISRGRIRLIPVIYTPLS